MRDLLIMMKRRLLSLLGLAVLGLALVLLLGAQRRNPPAGEDANPRSAAASLEQRANTAFEQQDYTRALPLLIRLAEQHRNDPARLGPIQEKIRVCQRAMGGELTEAQMQPGAGPPGRTGPRKPHVRPDPGQALEVAIRELGNFEYDSEVGGNIPDDVQKLDGAILRTRGFMIPLDQADNITEFALVPSLFDCCFGQPPALQHMITVTTPKGKGLAYFPEEIIVEGTLRVKEVKDEDLIISLFHVDCTSVKPAGR
jgi:hypothetical protein